MPITNAPTVDPMPALARELSVEHCRIDPATGERCSWYHGLWQDLRAVGIAASATRQRTLYEQGLAAAAVGTRPRVLVSGAADHAIFGEVLAACDALGLEPDVTVLDLCETPLRLCEAYAKRLGRAVSTMPVDIFAYEPSQPFDVICSHSFAGLFPPTTRRKLFARWTEMLAPGGALVVVNRVRDVDPTQLVSLSESSARALCEMLDARLRAGQVEDAVREQALSWAEVYVRRLAIYPLSETELRSLNEGAGLSVELTARTTSGDPKNAACSGVAVAVNATHACVVGRKR